MDSRLPNDFVGDGQAAIAYRKCIFDFSDKDYENKQSAKLAKTFLDRLNNVLYEIIPKEKDHGQAAKSIKGTAFELLTAEMLQMHGITPLYAQAKMRNVPQSKIDFLLYDEHAPIIFTCKMSLAERWRQAAYEGMCLKQVYYNAECYVICADENEVRIRNKDIKNKEISGINWCYMVDSEELQELFINLSNRNFSLAKDINPIIGIPKIVRKIE